MRCLDIQQTSLNIFNMMNEKNMTCTQVSQSLGLTYQAVHKWLTGTGLPTLDNIVTLSGIFNCSIEDLIVYKEIK